MVLSDSYPEIDSASDTDSSDAVKNPSNFEDISPDDKISIFENSIDF